MVTLDTLPNRSLCVCTCVCVCVCVYVCVYVCMCDTHVQCACVTHMYSVHVILVLAEGRWYVTEVVQ